MSLEWPLESASDDDVLRGLADILGQSRRVESALVAHIGEVEARHLYARSACSSMYGYCTEVLHLSEGETYLRRRVGRAAREYPVLLAMLADGRLHLSSIALLEPHLTPENRETLVARAVHKTKRQVAELVAELAPRPDVPSAIRKLPTRLLRPYPAEVPRPEPGPDAVVSPPRVEPAPRPTPVPTFQPLSRARYKVEFTAGTE